MTLMYIYLVLLLEFLLNFKRLNVSILPVRVQVKVFFVSILPIHVHSKAHKNLSVKCFFAGKINYERICSHHCAAMQNSVIDL